MDSVDLNDRETHSSNPQQKEEKQHFSLVPRKPAQQTSRVSKIRQAVLQDSTNDENSFNQKSTFQTELSEEGQLLRSQYGEHKRQSKSRDRSNNRPAMATSLPPQSSNETETLPENKFKRAKQDNTFQQKYQRLEENFKKFTTNMQDRKKSPINAFSTASLQDPQVSLLNFTQQFKRSQQERDSEDQRQTALRLVLRQIQYFLQTLGTHLQQLSVSHDQEVQINNLLALVDLEQASTSKLLETQIAAFMADLQKIFAQVMQRVYQIESATFLNYKFKDVLHLFESLVQESYRLQVNDLMPSILQTIHRVRAQAGFIMINSCLQQAQHRKVVHSFKRWQGKPGRSYQLAKLCTHIERGQKLRQQTSAFQIWATSSAQQNSLNNFSVLSKLVFSQDKFQECLQSDTGLVLQIQDLMKEEKQINCDLIMIEAAQVSYYDHMMEQMSTVALQAVKGSVTFSQEGLQLGQPVKVVQKLLAQRNYDEKIDRPMLHSESLSGFKHDMSVVLIPLYSDYQEPPRQNAVLRVFRSGVTHLTTQLRQTLITLAMQIQAFVNRVHQLRNKMVSLQDTIQVNLEVIRVAELEQTVHKCLFDLISRPQSTKKEFLTTVVGKTEMLLKQLFTGDTLLRQVYMKSKDPYASLLKIIETPLLEETAQQSLIRQRNHKEAGADILIDWLDYQRDLLVQQVSIDTPTMTVILHKLVPNETKREQHLHQDQRFTLSLLAKCLEPVLVQGLKIHEDLASQVEHSQNQLYRQVQIDLCRQTMRDQLQSLSICEEKDLLEKVTNVVRQVYSDDSQVVVEVAVMVTSTIMSGEQGQSGKLVGYLTNKQISELLELPQHFNEELDSIDRYESPSATFKDLKQFSLNQSQTSLLKFPIYDTNQTILAVIALELTTPQKPQQLKLFTSHIQTELQQLLSKSVTESLQQEQFKHSFNEMKDKIQALSLDIDFMQAVQELLVLPFTLKPSLRNLGMALTELTTKTIPMALIQSIQLYVDNKLVNEDIRMMLFIQNGSMMPPSQSASDEPHITFTDGILKIHLPSKDNRFLVLNLELPSATDENTNLLVQHVQVYQQIIAPFVSQALGSLTQSLLPVTQEHLVRVLVKLQKQREYSMGASFLLSLRDLQVNKVPIFSRLKSYKRVLRVRPFQYEGYLEDDRRQFLTKQHVLQVYAHAFKSLNRLALQTKQRAFNRYKLKTLELLQIEQEQLYSIAKYQPTKRQRKSFQLIACLVQKLQQRAHFSKLAVKCKLYRKLSNPHCRAFAAAMCISHNFTQIRMRVGFHKMRGNALNKCYRDFEGIALKDRDFMLDIQRDLLKQLPALNTPQSSQALEAQITHILEKSMIYLQETLVPESLDVIVCSLQTRLGANKARAYLFNKSSEASTIQRMESRDVLDQVVSENIEYMGQTAQLQDFNVNMKKDIILQMMSKSGQMFNFSNISNSLYELYQTQFGKTQDKDVVARMLLLKKSKSALLCPLVVEADDQLQLIGSLELYRFYGQVFEPEVESRMKVFTNQLQDICNLFLRMRQTQLQISDLKNEISLAVRPASSLTALLRNIQQKGATQLNCQHFQCLILNENGLAYFYQFKDSYIYNFAYGGTLIDEILEQQSVLELASRTTDLQDSDLQQLNDQHRLRTVSGQLKTITNVGGFSRILYYPVVCEGKIKAVFEVGYTSTTPSSSPYTASCDNNNQGDILHDTVVSLLTQFSFQLSQQLLKLKALTQTTESIITRKRLIAKTFAFMQLKGSQALKTKQKQYETQQNATITQTQNCLQEYLSNLESYDIELRKMSEQKEQLTAEVNALRVDRQTKFKLLGTCLTVMTRLEKVRVQTQVQKGFDTWRANAKIAKVIETAFNKMLELNYKHAGAQYHAAAFLLKRSCIRRLKRSAFESITKFSQMNVIGGGQVQNSMMILDSGYQSARSNHQFGQILSSKNASMKVGTAIFSDKTVSAQQPSAFQRSQLNAGSSQLARSMIYSSGQVTPVITNINVQNSHLQYLHDQMGFGAVPKGVSKREGGTMAKKQGVQHKKTRSKSKSVGRSAPQTGRIVIN